MLMLPPVTFEIVIVEALFDKPRKPPAFSKLPILNAVNEIVSALKVEPDTFAAIEPPIHDAIKDDWPTNDLGL